MSLSKPRDGEQVVASREYLDFRHWLLYGSACTLDQITPSWPDFSVFHDFRGKKQGVARELERAEACGGGIKCSTAILPRRPIISEHPAGTVPLNSPENADYASIAQSIASRLPEFIEFDQLNVYVREISSLGSHRIFEEASGISRGRKLPLSRLGWFLNTSHLACLINLNEVLIRLEHAKGDGTDDRRGTSRQVNCVCPDPLDIQSKIVRPFASWRDDTRSTLLIVGCGLSASELKDWCEGLSRRFTSVLKHRHSIEHANSSLIEIW